MSHQRKQFEKRKLEKLLQFDDWYPCPAYFSDRKGRVVRQYVSEFGARVLKKISNREIRRKVKNVNFELPSGKSQYQKLFDYWWELT